MTNELVEMIEKIEEERILVEGDTGEEYLDIPIEEWNRLRELVMKNVPPKESL